MTPFARTGYTPIEHEPRTAAGGGSKRGAPSRCLHQFFCRVLVARRLFCIYQFIYLLVFLSLSLLLPLLSFPFTLPRRPHRFPPPFSHPCVYIACAAHTTLPPPPSTLRPVNTNMHAAHAGRMIYAGAHEHSRRDEDETKRITADGDDVFPRLPSTPCDVC